ncbi:hypothetical protein ONS95_002536 [Cadophora gregata]|uniref:uncharacterized protein n=1 Tax=Cadophora gregata TaxID=51156 RepID=UPI0026DBB175|nr:uncharacterized protein ONS95_002536 [Cadophora gregata]KAK0109865.1 hypothetical protein ONS95_002536 [Cadophora gregata]
MNLSSLVHSGRHQVEQQFQPYPSRAHIMASSLVANPYTAQPLGQSPGYTYVTAPQPPPSPPVDEVAKCSLPSISSLLGLADGSNPQEQQSQQQSQQQVQTKTEYRPDSGHQHYGPSPVMASRGALPPTPPMQSESGFDGRQSPSAGSNSGYSVASAPGYYFAPSSVSSINNIEPHAQRQHVPQLQRRVSMPVAAMAYAQSPYNASQYSVSPQQSMSSYYPSPMQATPPPQAQISGLYYQRPLPQVCLSLDIISSFKANFEKAIPPTINACLSHPYPILWRKSMAASPLHLPIIRGLVSSIPRSLHLPDLQQGLLQTLQLTNPLALSYWGKAIQVPTPRMREGVQRQK